MITRLKNFFARLGARLRRCATTICNRLNRLGKDKYQHFAAGVVLAAFGAVVPLLLGLPMWFALGYSALAVGTLAAIKEYAVDSAPDGQDLLATGIGGAVVWVVVLIFHFVR